MATITVPYNIMPKGYRLSGDVRSGIKAVVPCYMGWGDAFTFVNEVLNSPQAERIGLITWNAPYQFPVQFTASTPAIYVQAWDIQPCGAGYPNGTTAGLAPGEFYSHAIVTLTFESISYINNPSDDPYNLNQLDPANPITACEQSVKLRGKMRTIKNKGYVYKTSGKPVNGDFAMPEGEGTLILKFPRVPYLPWSLVAPYIGKVNAYPMLQASTGALLLEGLDTDVTPQPDGSIQQKAVLEFAVNMPGDPNAGGDGAVGTDWNLAPTGDGSGGWDYIVPKSSTSTPMIGYADFRTIFNSLSF